MAAAAGGVVDCEKAVHAVASTKHTVDQTLGDFSQAFMARGLSIQFVTHRELLRRCLLSLTED